MRLSQGQIFWREVGNGPAVIFLHGTWSDGRQWLSVVESLSLNYHCFVPDLLGFGESEKPNVHYSIQLEVECLQEYLEALGLRQVYLVGHSLGGWIAASYALKYLERVRGLVLLSPEGVRIERMGRRWWWARRLLLGPIMLFELLRSLSLVAKLQGWQEKIEQALQRRQQLQRSSTACKLLFQRRQSEIAAELLQERLPWLKIPVLILQGGQDTPIAQALAQTYADLVPAAQLQGISQGENDLPQLLPDIVAQHIRDFIDVR